MQKASLLLISEEGYVMTRREIRENVFKMLFRVEFHSVEELSEQMSLFQEELDQIKEEDLTYIREKCQKIIDSLPELDGIINEKSTGWKTSRMSKVDLSIIRLAVYEIKKEDDIPDKVAINEAVELAKKYGTDDSSAFVNGILAKFVA